MILINMRKANRFSCRVRYEFGADRNKLVQGVCVCDRHKGGGMGALYGQDCHKPVAVLYTKLWSVVSSLFMSRDTHLSCVTF